MTHSPPTQDRPVVLRLAGVAYAYPDGHQALFGVDLTVRRGERVAVLGPNGAGKTTLVHHLNGILTPGAGSVTVAGTPVTKSHLARVRRQVGLVFQHPDDQLFMSTVREDVAFGPATAGIRGAELARRVDRALADVGLTGYASRPPHHLSCGQRRRAALATVLASEPEILALDEPSANLDPRARRELVEILRALDVTALLVTHDLPYALELCPRAVILSDGVIVADGPHPGGAERRRAVGRAPAGVAVRIRPPFGATTTYVAPWGSNTVVRAFLARPRRRGMTAEIRAETPTDRE